MSSNISGSSCRSARARPRDRKAPSTASRSRSRISGPNSATPTRQITKPANIATSTASGHRSTAPKAAAQTACTGPGRNPRSRARTPGDLRASLFRARAPPVPPRSPRPSPRAEQIGQPVALAALTVLAHQLADSLHRVAHGDFRGRGILGRATLVFFETGGEMVIRGTPRNHFLSHDSSTLHRCPRPHADRAGHAALFRLVAVMGRKCGAKVANPRRKCGDSNFQHNLDVFVASHAAHRLRHR